MKRPSTFSPPDPHFRLFDFPPFPSLSIEHCLSHQPDTHLISFINIQGKEPNLSKFVKSQQENNNNNNSNNTPKTKRTTPKATTRTHLLLIMIVIIIITFKGAIRDFLLSPHSDANCLQHDAQVAWAQPCAKSRATHRALITCKCHVGSHADIYRPISVQLHKMTETTKCYILTNLKTLA